LLVKQVTTWNRLRLMACLVLPHFLDTNFKPFLFCPDVTLQLTISPPPNSACYIYSTYSSLWEPDRVESTSHPYYKYCLVVHWAFWQVVQATVTSISFKVLSRLKWYNFQKKSFEIAESFALAYCQSRRWQNFGVIAGWWLRKGVIQCILSCCDNVEVVGTSQMP
jgi:hypothetical protein